MRGGGGAWYEELISLPLVVRTASITAPPFRSGPARGALFVIYVKAIGTSTFNFRASATDPAFDQGWNVSANVAITGTGVYVVVAHPFASKQPNGEAAATAGAAVIQTISIPAPGFWRPSIVKGDASPWEFGVSVRRLR